MDQTKRRIKRPTLTFSVTLTLPFLFILFLKKLNVQACYINTQIQGQCIYCYNVFLKLTFDFINSYCLLEAIFLLFKLSPNIKQG